MLCLACSEMPPIRWINYLRARTTRGERARDHAEPKTAAIRFVTHRGAELRRLLLRVCVPGWLLRPISYPKGLYFAKSIGRSRILNRIRRSELRGSFKFVT